MVALPFIILGEVRIKWELLFSFVLVREGYGSQSQSSLPLFYQEGPRYLSKGRECWLVGVGSWGCMGLCLE